ncbi:MAG: phosphoribosylformylglycinamidine synthase subunit PurQ [bacterium]|nr:phosphoribosylformylglycinamidine synthase subunit PurQ [bacterium]
MKFGVIIFPGSNCDRDCYHVVDQVMGQPVDFIWHGADSVDGYDGIILPGGFSYGDYLRTGAIARFSPVMGAVEKAAAAGKTVIGICNGFQILTEAGMLPGVLRRNESLQFICKFLHLKVEHNESAFTNACSPGQVLRVPIAHGEGNYYADPEVLAGMEENGQILFRYCEADGTVSAAANPNGSLENIAGICNREGNVMGMMPHPERSSEEILTSADGRFVFESILRHFKMRNCECGAAHATCKIKTAKCGVR